jgi:glycosyltransferase involved in cell wall biosynthesis
MKIGIYLGEMDQTVGGGYTFFESIVSELCKIKSCKHRFVLFSYSNELLKHFSPCSEFVEHCLLQQAEYKPSLSEKILNRIRTPIISLPSPIAEKINERKIQLMWYITSHTGSLDIPYLYTVWDLQHRLQPFFPEVSSNGEWMARERKMSEVIRRAAFVLAGTQQGKSEISLFYNIPEERIKILPHPTPSFALAGLVPDVSIFSKASFEKNYLFYPAQFWAHKNHVTILKALQELNKKGNKLNVIFTGSNKGNLSYIESKIREFSLDKQVDILGFVTREQLVALYQNALALVYPTCFGPENLPPLEAFALGCPVIASSVPGSEEQIGDCALFFHPTDPTQLADKIQFLSSNDNVRNALIQKGLNRARQYTTVHYIKDIVALFDSFEPLREAWGDGF